MREAMVGDFDNLVDHLPVVSTKICISRHFSSKQARTNSLMSGLFERKMPFFS
jgi:hypothetical protein